MWPENWQAVQVFIAMSTQWRMGADGPVGLDYMPMPFVLRMMGVGRGDWPEVFDQVRVMERAAVMELRR